MEERAAFFKGRFFSRVFLVLPRASSCFLVPFSKNFVTKVPDDRLR